MSVSDGMPAKYLAGNAISNTGIQQTAVAYPELLMDSDQCWGVRILSVGDVRRAGQALQHANGRSVRASTCDYGTGIRVCWVEPQDNPGDRCAEGFSIGDYLGLRLLSISAALTFVFVIEIVWVTMSIYC